jgi:hypothetical protein
MSPADVKKLLAHLAENNVQHFKCGDIEIAFYPKIQEPTKPTSSPSLADKLTEIAKTEASNMPPDLRADDTMNYDKILHWSGSPDPNVPDLPLTGEDAL